jgi:hypothetical protein
MKKFITLLCFITAISCNSKKSDTNKAEVQASIQIHNLIVKGRFQQDSLKEKTSVEIQHIGIRKSLVDSVIQTHMTVYSNEWNEPYDIKRDRFLTFEKYMEYCKAHNVDAKTFYKFLD